MNYKIVCAGMLTWLCLAGQHLSAQNADEIIYNQYKQSYSYAGGSFAIDTGKSLVQNQKRAFLIWAANIKPDTLQHNLSLAEFSGSGNYLSQKATTAHSNASLRTLFPKKMIKGRKDHVYYLLGYITNSSHLINNQKVYSTPVIYKIDGNTLNLIWASRISLSAVNTNNAQTLIEYNDMIETKDGNIVVVGRYATGTNQKQYALSAKLSGSTGALLWRYYYNWGNTCNEGINAAAETTDGNISLIGYVSRCSGNTFTGAYDMFYSQITAAGTSVAGTYKRFVWQGKLNLWGDNITCYTNSAGSDQLVASGYVDIPFGNTSDRQILIANLKQNSSTISLQHIGDTLQDVASDLIFQQVGQQDYGLFLTGSTNNYFTSTARRNEAFFTSLKFNAGSGVSGISEFSILPVGTAPYNTHSGRTGIEIKNAGSYKKFAILATGSYKPAKAVQTYTDILIRDFSDVNGGCIKRYNPPVKSFSVHEQTATAQNITPALKVYAESWIKLDSLSVKQLCQQVKIDPYEAASRSPDKASMQVSMASPELVVTPNPVRDYFTLSAKDKKPLTGNGEKAIIYVYNTSKQLLQTVRVAPNAATVSISAGALKPDLYYLQLVQAGNIRTVAFSKQ